MLKIFLECFQCCAANEHERGNGQATGIVRKLLKLEGCGHFKHSPSVLFKSGLSNGLHSSEVGYSEEISLVGEWVSQGATRELKELYMLLLRLL